MKYQVSFCYLHTWKWRVLLYKQECLTGKYNTHKIYTKPHTGLGWCVLHILNGEHIDYFTFIMFLTLEVYEV